MTLLIVCSSRIHAGETPFICATCGMGFPQKARLNAHERAVHSDRPREVSKNNHNQLGTLMIFDQLHCIVQERAYRNFPLQQRYLRNFFQKIPCKVCGNLVGRRHMWQHLKNHEGSTKSFCSVCGKEFPTASSRHVGLPIFVL